MSQNIKRIIGIICLLLIVVLIELEDAINILGNDIAKLLPLIPAAIMIVVCIRENKKEDEDDNSGAN
jgi:hypothetical protein